MNEDVPSGRAGPDPLGESPGAAVGPGAGVPSPCTSVCRMSATTGWCEGCFRTIDEIIAWSKMADDGKRRVWQLLPARRQAAGPAQLKKGC
ncbi:DUF1289 domain-containing protein [Ideonella sp.]|uniref:DUF1289 domain-containing protein n=1 Tax=Ideonella sp. TaxID=1929293 RepID=UPI0039C87A86